ncbi:hypothetical protein SLEP1_g17538 [Rubroshorea leprosula]|uniref:Uncharacterized protein n=1 Tax=Rubroshorea leprosula TaxID=152421 RepID=A0AAV5J260_9ROSI|nr:hypothetical protein SLEP1_g17538 [Rubroshorea leprosula]
MSPQPLVAYLMESFRICLALLLTAGCSCFVGISLEFLLHLPPAFFPLLGPVCSWKIWFPIVLSVSTEIEFSVLCE